jgi:hypothetical protein
MRGARLRHPTWLAAYAIEAAHLPERRRIHVGELVHSAGGDPSSLRQAIGELYGARARGGDDRVFFRARELLEDAADACPREPIRMI